MRKKNDLIGYFFLIGYVFLIGLHLTGSHPISGVNPGWGGYNESSGITRFVTLYEGNYNFDSAPQRVPIREIRPSDHIVLDVPNYVLTYPEPRIAIWIENPLNEPWTVSLVDNKIGFSTLMENGVARYEYVIPMTPTSISFNKSQLLFMCPLDVVHADTSGYNLSSCDAIHSTIVAVNSTDAKADISAQGYADIFWRQEDTSIPFLHAKRGPPLETTCYDWNVTESTFTTYSTSSTMKFRRVINIFHYYALKSQRKLLDSTNIQRCPREKDNLVEIGIHYLHYSGHGTFAMTSDEYLFLVTPRHSENTWEPEIIGHPGQEVVPILEIVNCTRIDLSIQFVAFYDPFYLPRGFLLDKDSITLEENERLVLKDVRTGLTDFVRASKLVTLSFDGIPDPKGTVLRITAKAASLSSPNLVTVSFNFTVKGKPKIDLDGMVEISKDNVTRHIFPLGQHTVKGRLSGDLHAKLGLYVITKNQTEPVEVSDFSWTRGDAGGFNFPIILNPGQSFILLSEGDGGVSDTVIIKPAEKTTSDRADFIIKPLGLWGVTDYLVTGLVLFIVAVIIYYGLRKKCCPNRP
ncbi:uncharacterized protein LOC118437706 [Folsomia candida]|nr:uncharacterized protein LOC118437706 [Folsomia candida]